jgi:dihydroxy-acid dehydratase
MEAGEVEGKKYDLVDAMVMAADQNVSDEQISKVERDACPTCGSCSGMFTANSMNCLAEALGLALPGNGTIVATHANRKRLFEEAANRIVEMTYDYYKNGNGKVLPRNIATLAAFCNAMKLDIAMGGSTNTVLHILAIAAEGEVNFTMKDIDELSKVTPNLCKVAPNGHYHIEDVNRAGGILGILAELARMEMLDVSVQRADGLTLKEAIEKYDVMSATVSDDAFRRYKSAPGGGRNLVMGSQENYFKELDTDRADGCIRDYEHAYNKDGGLAVLYGNIARNGCIVKTAGVDPSVYHFKGTAKVFQSQDDACNGILGDKVQAGDVVVIRYEGPKGGPGMQEMLYPTSYIKSMGLGKACALITDGRFSGGTSGLSIGHISPEAAAGGEIALVQDGDLIEIDIPNRKIDVLISDEEMEARRAAEVAKGKDAFVAIGRKRQVSKALKAYASMVSSADRGAIRLID